MPCSVKACAGLNTQAIDSESLVLMLWEIVEVLEKNFAWVEVCTRNLAVQSSKLNCRGQCTIFNEKIITLYQSVSQYTVITSISDIDLIALFRGNDSHQILKMSRAS